MVNEKMNEMPLLRSMVMSQPCICGVKHRTIEKYLSCIKHALSRWSSKLEHFFRELVIEKFSDLTFDDLPPFCSRYVRYSDLAHALTKPGMLLMSTTLDMIFSPTLDIFPAPQGDQQEFVRRFYFDICDRAESLREALYSNSLHALLKTLKRTDEPAFLAQLLVNFRESQHMGQALLKIPGTEEEINRWSKALKYGLAKLEEITERHPLLDDGLSISKIAQSVPCPLNCLYAVDILELDQEHVVYYHRLVRYEAYDRLQKHSFCITRYRFRRPRRIELALVPRFSDFKNPGGWKVLYENGHVNPETFQFVEELARSNMWI